MKLPRHRGDEAANLLQTGLRRFGVPARTKRPPIKQEDPHQGVHSCSTKTAMPLMRWVPDEAQPLHTLEIPSATAHGSGSSPSAAKGDLRRNVLQSWLESGLLQCTDEKMFLVGASPYVRLPDDQHNPTGWTHVPSWIRKEDIRLLPLQSYPRQPRLLRTHADAKAVVTKLLRLAGASDAAQKTLGLDLEWRPMFKAGESQHPPAVVQIATSEEVYVFQLTNFDIGKEGLPGPERVRRALDVLRPVLEHPGLFKTGVGLIEDAALLETWCPGTRCKSMIDLTSVAAKMGFRMTSLLHLACLVLGHRMSKKQQTSNWERASLAPNQILYAATDAWISRQLALRLLDVDSLHEQAV